MTTNSLNDYSTTVASNSNIAGTSIAVGCAPADVGIFMRTIMAQLAYAVQGPPNLFPATWYAGELDTNTSNGGTGNANVANNLVVGGSITLSNPTLGYSPSVWQNIASYTLAGAASQAVALPTGYRRFKLTLQNITTNTNGSFPQLQFSSNGGVSYFNTNYVYATSFSDPSGVTGAGGSSSFGAIPLTNALTTSGSPPAVADGTYEIYPGSVATKPSIRGSAWSLDSVPDFLLQTLAGNYNGAAGLVNFISISANSGTISGLLILEGLV